MLTGLDHVIIAVNDLASAVGRFGDAMRLVVAPGGAHPGWGTHNAIARFGLDYLELLAIRDQNEASIAPAGLALARFLAQGEGLMGFALASDDIAADVAGMKGRGVAMAETVNGRRRRPDGTLMAWQMATVAGDALGQILPFIIQHSTPPAERQMWVPEGGHPLAAIGISGVAVAVADLDSAVRRYSQYLGKPPEVTEVVPALPAQRAVFMIGEHRLELLQSTASSGGLHDFVRQHGDGLFLVSLAVPDVAQAVLTLRERGTAVGDATMRRRAPLLDPRQTLGARFQLVERQ